MINVTAAIKNLGSKVISKIIDIKSLSSAGIKTETERKELERVIKVFKKCVKKHDVENPFVSFIENEIKTALLIKVRV